jgi:GNAT superfamily N-acetyltransferase
MGWTTRRAARDEADRQPALPTGELIAIYADPARRGTGLGFALPRKGSSTLGTAQEVRYARALSPAVRS